VPLRINNACHEVRHGGARPDGEVTEHELMRILPRECGAHWNKVLAP